MMDEHGRSQGLGLSQLIPNCRPLGCGLLSPNPSPIAKFLPQGVWEGFQCSFALKRKLWMVGEGLPEPGPRAGYPGDAPTL